ncbi:MAG: thioredoxin domain-containing protein, partial [Candidatus Xenobia bacterium]
PIFLSVGYSTCHWCHVMERESFENEEIARLLNERFVAVKVDREERPDVDHVYMTFVQATTGSGGWPMSVFLTPDLKPFFGGTYFPPESRWGQPGFKQVLTQLSRMWEGDRGRLEESARNVMTQLQRFAAAKAGAEPLREDVLRQAWRHFQQSYDRRHGGFEGAPKFPRPVVFNFLLRYARRSALREAVDMTVATLKKMARGGVHDHLGGGFHRYSVDAEWHVPHFEKMLYDQAQLAVAAIEAWQITKDVEMAAIARDILGYVKRTMTSPEGAFWSAEDADSVIDPAHPEEKGEGAFYVWSQDEIQSILEPDEARAFCARYDVRPDGNVAQDPHGEFGGRNILHVTMDLDVLEHSLHLTVESLLANAHQKLLAMRERRPRPHLDDKVLTSWNGLMISAFARAIRTVGDASDRDAAVRAATFILERLRQPDGELKRRYRDGAVGVEANLDDYAFFIAGLLDLYEATLEWKWLEAAIELQKKQNELFWDDEQKAFFDTTGRDASVLLRARSDYDGAEPAPGSIAALNLARLGEMTDNATWREMARQTVEATLGRPPAAIPQMLVAADFLLATPQQVVLAGPAPEAMLDAIGRHFHPHRVVLGAHAPLPHLEAMTAREGQATAYVCTGYTCQAPTTDLEALSRLLEG